VILVAAAALAAAAYGGRRGTSASAVAPTTAPSTSTTTTPPPDNRNAIQKENDKIGTRNWGIGAPVEGISGYANRVSVQQGEAFTLYVSSVAPEWRVYVYRMGWYGGSGGRQVWKSPLQKGVVQPGPVLVKATRTSTAPWTPSLTITVPRDWMPGEYLLKLVSGISQSYVPITIRSDTSDSTVLVVSAVTTWQAYNDWGAYSLYHGPGEDPGRRSNIVTFDRPYSRDGSGDFLSGELGLVALVEKMGLNVSYTTDIDVHEHPELLTHHKVLVSLGHDEYWTKAMRDGIEAARDRGVNIMFLGANALFRRIRLQPSTLGPDREEVNYRSVGDDPGYRLHPDEPTTNWREGPKAKPESSLTGTFYECNPVNVDGVVADASSWVFQGTGLKNGDHLPLLIGTEYDRVNANAPTPPDIEVLLHSPLKCAGKRSFADAAYYTAPSGAGVFDAGTGAWVCKLFTGCPADRPLQADRRIQRITANILRVFATGPAGRVHASHSNLDTIDQTSQAPSVDG
jgi:hypothetical protein